MSDIKLSICIPTFNRAQFIVEAIDSVISQACDNIEIVVVDGASTDNTEKEVCRLKQRFNNLVYYRGKKNMGVDRDMAKSIELARGEYCWMLSDDDLLKPGAIKKILREIESGCEIYLCNVTACSLSMQPIRERFWLTSKVKDRVYNLHEKGAFIEYCDNADSIGALFSYMSSIVLRREEWIKTGYDFDFDLSAYALASTLFSFTKRRCRLKYIKSPLVFWRNDNQSFQNEGGLVKRFLLDFNGYLKLADKYLSGDRKVKESFLRVMRREHPWYTIIHAASFIDSPGSWDQFKGKMRRFGYSPIMTEICYVLGRYKGFVSLGVKIKRKIVKSPKVHKIIGLLFRK